MHKEVKSIELNYRTLESLVEDNSLFQKADGTKEEVAKYNNSLHPPLLEIEPDKIAPPYLHILLGIVLKHHKLLENAAHAIDKKIISLSEDYLTDLGKIVKEYGAEWRQAQKLQSQLEFEHGCLAFSEAEEDIRHYRAEKEKTEHKLSHLHHTELKPRIGPVAASLDNILTKHRITPQAYHSKSFVGNHCHKYMTAEVYKALTQTIVTQTQACTINPLLIDEAFQVKLLYDDLNDAFSKVHTAISHSKSIKEESVKDIQTLIDNYMALYRRQFPKKTFPKQHILECHCIPHITQYKLGLGLLGEQGTESNHQTIYLEKFRARGIINSTQKLKHIMTAHLVNILSSLTL
ncbi:amine oxidase [Plakobranchus ocellatus]|uniref:Amine oxidase n=1 Tax=Plakobranchus ocellatus TaxID=259542 RepID=A0AAV4AY35_9GAST|nr:amine oxidase [Plakobranchus ocellatus]